MFLKMWCKRFKVTFLLYRLSVASSSASLLHFYVCVVFTIFMPPIPLNFECVFIDFFFRRACRNSSSSARTINIRTEPSKGITLIKVAETEWMTLRLFISKIAVEFITSPQLTSPRLDQHFT